MAVPGRVLPDFASMDAPAAGDGEAKMVPTEEHPVAPPVSREENIAALLAQGQRSLRQFRLLTPAGDNANRYFKEVLALDPGNADARQGFNRIAERYAILARRAIKRQDSKLAKVYIEPPPKETGFFACLKSLFTLKQDHSAEKQDHMADARIQRQESNRASGRWAINLVSLQQKVDAEHFVIKVNSKGVEAVINQVTVGGKKYWRVQVPGFSSPDEARAKANEVQDMLRLKDVWIVQS